jgi:translation initiation factor 1
MRPTSRSQPPVQQEAHIRREKKGRGGKTVTVVYNLRLAPDALKALGKHLRQACGTGGTVKDGAIEIQGDHRDRVAETLQQAGYRTKFTGG